MLNGCPIRLNNSISIPLPSFKYKRMTEARATTRQTIERGNKNKSICQTDEDHHYKYGKGPYSPQIKQSSARVDFFELARVRRVLRGCNDSLAFQRVYTSTKVHQSEIINKEPSFPNKLSIIPLSAKKLKTNKINYTKPSHPFKII